MKKLLINLVFAYYFFEFLISRIIFSRKEDSIIIIKMDAIGDMIIWLDSAKEYKRKYNSKKIVLLCNEISLDIVNRTNYFDEIILINKKKFLFNFLYRTKIILKLSRRKFDIIINPVFARDYFYQDTLVRCLKSHEKISAKGIYTNTTHVIDGFVKDINYSLSLTNKLYKYSSKWYTKEVFIDTNIENELNRNADFIRKLIDKSFKSSLPKIAVGGNSSKFNLNDNYVVLFVGAGSKHRLWKSDYFAQVVKELNKYNILICAGRGEEYIWENIKNHLDDYHNVTNLIGKTTLTELITIISNAKFIITNETSASHITVAVRTPSVCILAGSHYGRFHPYVAEYVSDYDKKYLPKIVCHRMDCFGCDTLCKYIKDKETIWPCIEKITSEQVLEKIFEIEKEIKSYESKDINNNGNI